MTQETAIPEDLIVEQYIRDIATERLELIQSWGEAKRLVGQAQMQHFNNCALWPYSTGSHPLENCGYVQPMQQRADHLWAKVRAAIDGEFQA